MMLEDIAMLRRSDSFWEVISEPPADCMRTSTELPRPTRASSRSPKRLWCAGAERRFP